MILIEDIKQFLNVPILGNDEKIIIKRPSALNDADEDSIIWIKSSISDIQSTIKNSPARAIIVSDKIDLKVVEGKVLFRVNNPRLSFIKVIQKFFVRKILPEIHPTAFIHPEAVISESAYIGPFTYIGKSRVGPNSIIHGNVYIYDQVTIGSDVIINSGTVIGADGFGYEKDESGEIHKFPHIGGVLIEDEVEIGSNTCIDKGSLGNTILKRGAKIDNLVHIAHNVIVGENAFVIANAMIGGSTVIGDNCWISPSVSLMNGINIGKDSTVGMSSLVTKSITDSQIYAGIPARPIDEFIKLQQKLKKL